MTPRPRQNASRPARRGLVGRAVTLAILLALAALSMTCSGSAPREIPEAPHPIIVIDIDSLRADHLGCYGAERPTSPAIDILAGESLLFRWAFGQAADTAPAQASILTGLYPTTHGLVDDRHRLSEEVVTLAEALAEHGYTTAAFVDGGFMSADFGLAQGFDLYDSSGGGGLAEIGPKVLSWLRAHASERFLLLVHSYDPHVPYDPPEPHRSVFLEGLEAPSEGFEPTPQVLEAVRSSLRSEDPEPLPPNDLEYAKALYDGEIRLVDEWVGRIVDEVRQLRLADRATIVLVSDHGQEFQEHGLLLHDGLYAPVTRVPLMVRLPGGFAAGVIDKVVEAVDLMPTLLELAGVPPRPGLQGESLVPLMRGQGTPPYLAFGESADNHRYVALGAYRMLLDRDTDAVELYNVLEDPIELEDLAAAEEERVAVLRRHLEAWEERVQAAALGADEGSVADDTLEQLKSLGYIQ